MIGYRRRGCHIGGVVGPQLAAPRLAVPIHNQPDDRLSAVGPIVFRAVAAAERRAALLLEGQGGGVYENDTEFSRGARTGLPRRDPCGSAAPVLGSRSDWLAARRGRPRRGRDDAPAAPSVPSGDHSDVAEIGDDALLDAAALAHVLDHIDADLAAEAPVADKHVFRLSESGDVGGFGSDPNRILRGQRTPLTALTPIARHCPRNTGY